METPPLLSPPARTHTWQGLVPWLVIAAVLAVIFYRNNLVASTQATHESELASLELKLIAEMGIGTKAAAAHSPQADAGQLTKRLGGFMTQADEFAKTPADELHAAIVAGEIVSKAEAMKRLAAIEPAAQETDLAQDVASARTIYTQGPGALAAAARQHLVNQQGFFGKLALTYGLPDSDPSRAELEAKSTGTLLRLGLVGMLLGLLLLVALGCCITAIVLALQGKIRRAYVPDPTINRAFVEGFTLYLVLYVGLGLGLRALNLNTYHWSWIAFGILPLVMAWTAWRGMTAEQRRQGFGWHTGRGVFLEMALGIAGYLAGLPVVIIGVIVSAKLARLAGTSAVHPIVFEVPGADTSLLVMLYLLAAVMAPVLEETMFRGALFHHLRRQWGWWISAGVVSFVFAALHPQGWTTIPVLGAIAMVLAAIREWRGTIVASMAAHAFNNFIAVTCLWLLFH